MGKKILYTATVLSHICQFHLPYLQAFQERGDQVHVAARDNLGEKNGLELRYADRYVPIPFQRSPKDPQNLEAYRRLKALIEAEDYDLIVCNTPVGGILTRLAARGARRKGTRVVYIAHGFHFYRGAPRKNWLVFYPLERAFSRLTDLVVTIAEEDAALARAMELYWWFADTPALELDGEDTLEVDGQVYTRVLEEGMDSLASLRLKLKEVFSDELVDRLLPAGQTKFLEREGRLYVTTGGWTPSGGEISRSWSTVSDTRLVCRVSVADGGERDLAAGERAYDLLYEKLGGHWLFTEFAPAP